MHSSLLLVGVVFAGLLRLSARMISPGYPQTLSQRWHQTLSFFLMPPLMLATTALAVIRMGHHGQMLGHAVGRLGCHLALAGGAIALVVLLVQGLQLLYSLYQLRQLPFKNIQGHESRWIDHPMPMAARVGWWHSELIVSSALVEQLDDEAIEAVLLHEQAHLHFHDTFWFFWLAGVHRLTRWLPQTDALWQELLLLRELRADRWAAQLTDPLLLAETLLALTQASATACATHQPVAGVDYLASAHFGENQATSRLEARIQALLDNPIQLSPSPRRSLSSWVWLLGALLLSALPLLSSLYHCAT